MFKTYLKTCSVQNFNFIDFFQITRTKTGKILNFTISKFQLFTYHKVIFKIINIFNLRHKQGSLVKQTIEKDLLKKYYGVKTVKKILNQ